VIFGVKTLSAALQLRHGAGGPRAAHAAGNAALQPRSTQSLGERIVSKISRLDASIGPARVRIADVGGEEFEEANPGAITASGNERPEAAWSRSPGAS